MEKFNPSDAVIDCCCNSLFNCFCIPILTFKRREFKVHVRVFNQFVYAVVYCDYCDNWLLLLWIIVDTTCSM